MIERRFCLLVIAGITAGLIAAAPAHAAFPGQNGKIAFSGCGPVDCGVFTINPDGSDRIQVTHNSYSETFCTRLGCFVHRGRDQWPRWSPDGRKLLFQRESAGAVELYTTDAGGGNLTQVTDTTPAIESTPSWSPDGSRIAFTRFENIPGATEDQVFVANADGGAPVRIAAGEAPDWSPDGSAIAFAVADPPNSQFDFELHLVAPDGSNPRQITTSPPGERTGSRDPSWSPDGNRIAFAFAECCTWDPHIAMMQAGGGPFTLVTPDRTDDDDREPAFSPDGTKIVYEHDSFLAEQRELVMINDDGSGKTVLGPGTQPDWQPLVGPQRGEFKNASKFCKAERGFLGEPAFTQKYGGGANAHGRCVSGR